MDLDVIVPLGFGIFMLILFGIGLKTGRAPYPANTRALEVHRWQRPILYWVAMVIFALLTLAPLFAAIANWLDFPIIVITLN